MAVGDEKEKDYGKIPALIPFTSMCVCVFSVCV